MIREYLRLLVFATGLLAGVQVPGFIDQYQKRVDAHLQEVRQNMTGFQSTANHFFEGSIPKLIRHYESSGDSVFIKDAASVKLIYQRQLNLTAEAYALSGSWYSVAVHIARQVRTPLFQETLNQFTHTIPLTPWAMAWGLAGAVLLASVIDILLSLLGICITRVLRFSSGVS